MNETPAQTMERVLTELDKGKRDWELPKFLIKAWQWLEKYLSENFPGNAFWGFLFLAGLTGLLLFLLYMLIRFIIKRGVMLNSVTNKKRIPPKKKAPSALGNDPQKNRDSAAEEALKIAAKGDFSRALVRLHRGTVAYLYEKNLIKENRNYTNREIRSLLGEHALSTPFQKIAREAELIQFKNSPICKEKYEIMQNTYERYFCGGKE